MKTKTMVSLILATSLTAFAAHGQSNGVYQNGHASGRSVLRDRINHPVRSASLERDDWTVRQRGLRSTAAPASDPSSAAAVRAALATYPRYQLIDLGALGGENSFIVGAAKVMNNRGENISQASTGLPDPFDPDFWFQEDGTIWRGMFSTDTGVVQDLGGINGNQSIPTCLSENSLIAGFGENGLFDDAAGFPELRALFWDRHHVLHELGTLGGSSSQGQSVNNRGQLVGQATNATSDDLDVATFFNGAIPAAQQVRAFLWQRGAMTDLGTLGGNEAAATAINEAAAVAGYSATDTTINDLTGLPTVHPFLWQNGQMQDLGSLGGLIATTGSFTNGPWGRIMNAKGQVVGTSTLAGEETFHAFVRNRNQIIDLGTFGGDNSEAFFISDNGEVLGRAEVSLDPYVRHAFLWEKGHITDLGAADPCTRSTPLALNSRGQIVGDLGACTDDPDDVLFFSAFYQEKGNVPVDLHTLITTDTDIHLQDAAYINERGEISGGGFAPDGTMHAVLLVPIFGRN